MLFIMEPIVWTLKVALSEVEFDDNQHPISSLMWKIICRDPEKSIPEAALGMRWEYRHRSNDTPKSQHLKLV